MSRARDLLADAELSRASDRFEEARGKIAEALELARQSDEETLELHCLNELARIERDLGNPQAAISAYGELAGLYGKRSDDSGCAHALRHLGDIHREAEALDEADRCYERAMSLYRRLAPESGLGMANAMRGLALLGTRQGNNAEALALWTEARVIYGSNGVDSGVAECDEWIGKLA